MGFFGISGYVISYGFIHKRYVFGTESLKNFYINRFLRIYPLFFCVALFAWVIEYDKDGIMMGGALYQISHIFLLE